MPKEAARTFLKVVDVRVERIQDITTGGCRAEGLDVKKIIGDSPMPAGKKLIAEYEILWNKIYTDKGYGWDNNPWVWVIEFEKIKIEKS